MKDSFLLPSLTNDQPVHVLASRMVANMSPNEDRMDQNPIAIDVGLAEEGRS